MWARTVRTVSRTAALLSLALLCANCRREESAARSASPARASGAERAQSTADTEPPETSDSPWWSQAPTRLRNLSSADGKKREAADRLLKRALVAWREDALDSACDGIAEAEQAHAEVLGFRHWRTWDCKLVGALLQAEKAWTDQNRARAHELGLGHLINEEIRETLDRAAASGRADPAGASQSVDALCDLLKTSLAPPYDLLGDAYRQYYHARIAQARGQYALARGHFENSLVCLERLISSPHPLKARVHRDISLMLLYQTTAPGGLTAEERRSARIHACAALEMLGEWVPVDGEYVAQWIEALQTSAKWLRAGERFGPAKTAFARAADACRSFLPGSRESLSILLLDLAETCTASGDGYRALSILDYVRDKLSETLKADRAPRYRTERGFAHLRQGEYEEACRDFQHALDTWVGGKGRKRWRVHYLYGAALTKNHRFAEAIAQYEAAGKLLAKRHEGTRALADLFALRARVFEFARQGDLEGVREQVDQLTELTGNLGAAGEARRYRLLGYARLLLDQPQEAMRSLETAARHYQTARSTADLVPVDLGPWHEKESPYLLAAISALRLGEWDRAFEWLECHSGQALDALTQAAEADTTTWGGILRALADDDGARGAETQPSPWATSGALSSPGSVGLSEIGEILPADGSTAIVGWLDDVPEPGRPALPDRWVFVVRKHDNTAKLSFVQLEEDAIQPQDVIGAIIGPGGRTRWDALAYRLYQQRLAPIRTELEGVDRLYVLSRGLMLGVPVEALLVDEPDPQTRPQFLGDSFVIAYGPSCAVLRRLSKRPDRTANDCRILAVGGVESHDHPLPASGVEATTVSGYFGPGARILLGPEASELAFHQLSGGGEASVASAGYSHLHFAVHGEAYVFSPDRCYLELAGEARPRASRRTFLTETRLDDGHLGFREIMGLKSDASLVVLSACKTGLGRPLESEGYMGLPHAFFHAGARALLATLWSVEDVSAAMLMDRFYENLIQRRMNKAEALQEAKRHLRRQTFTNVVDWCAQHGAEKLAAGYVRSDDLAYSDPRYWAPYVLMGPHD